MTSTPLPKVVPTPLTNFTENLPKGITLEMVGLPAGQFLMGSPDSDPDAKSYEKPQHHEYTNVHFCVSQIHKSPLLRILTPPINFLPQTLFIGIVTHWKKLRIEQAKVRCVT